MIEVGNSGKTGWLRCPNDLKYLGSILGSHFFSLFLNVMTEYWAEFPVLYSRSLLVIYFKYSSVYISVSWVTFDLWYFCSGWFLFCVFPIRLFLVLKKEGHWIWSLAGGSQQKSPGSQNPSAVHHTHSWSYFADGEDY